MSFTASVFCSQRVIPKFIGVKGEAIKSMGSKYNVMIVIEGQHQDSDKLRTIVISGNIANSVSQAEAGVRESIRMIEEDLLLTKMPAVTIDHSPDEGVYEKELSRIECSEIIGPGGKNVKNIIQQCGGVVKIMVLDLSPKSETRQTLEITGPSDNVRQAAQIVEQIVQSMSVDKAALEVVKDVEGGGKICPHYLKGTCKYGDGCRNMHSAVPVAAAPATTTAPFLQLAQIMYAYCRSLPNSRMDAGKGFQKFKKEHPRWRAYDYKPKALCLDHPMLLTWIHDDDAPGKGWIYAAGSGPADNGNFSQSLLNDSQDDLLAVKGGAGDGPASSATGTPSHPATAPILQLAQIMSTYCRLLPNSRMDAGKGFQKFKKEHPRWRAYDYKPKALCLDHPMLLTWIHDDDAPGKGWIYVAGSEPQTAAKKGKSYSNSVVSCQSVHEKVSHNTSSLPPSFEYRRRSRFL